MSAAGGNPVALFRMFMTMQMTHWRARSNRISVRSSTGGAGQVMTHGRDELTLTDRIYELQGRIGANNAQTAAAMPTRGRA